VSEECLAGCCPHDSARLDDSASPDRSARPDAGCPGDLPGAPLPERAVHLRNCRLLPLSKIAAATGADRQFITRLLYEAATWAAPRGAVRRATGPAPEGALLDRVTAQAVRERQAPVARLSPPSRRGPSEIELLTALYADSQVRRVLDRHSVPVVNLTGAAWRRFPAPHPLTARLVSDLYEICGLSLHHIELLTGRPAAAAGAVLRADGVKLRPAGGRSPFAERWRLGPA
jgi:hypothetical protein